MDIRGSIERVTIDGISKQTTGATKPYVEAQDVLHCGNAVAGDYFFFTMPCRLTMLQGRAGVR